MCLSDVVMIEKLSENIVLNNKSTQQGSDFSFQIEIMSNEIKMNQIQNKKNLNKF